LGKELPCLDLLVQTVQQDPLVKQTLIHSY
jgi:hypothetical protein